MWLCLLALFKNLIFKETKNNCGILIYQKAKKINKTKVRKIYVSIAFLITLMIIVLYLLSILIKIVKTVIPNFTVKLGADFL